MKANTDTQLEQHGGSLSWIEAHYPHAARPWIDLSTGINPYPYPLPPVEAVWQNRLTDVSVMQAAAAKYYGLPPLYPSRLREENKGGIALAAGMQPLMVALAALRLKEYGVSKIGILSPTYGEHESVWKSMGHEVTRVETPGELA